MSVAKLGVSASILFMIHVTMAFTDQVEPTFGVGIMASKCGKLVDGMNDSVSLGRNHVAFAMLSWTEGYITATNMALEDNGEPKFDLGSLSSLELWSAIFGYCKRNPDEIAVKASIEAMMRLRQVQ